MALVLSLAIGIASLQSLALTYFSITGLGIVFMVVHEMLHLVLNTQGTLWVLGSVLFNL